MLVREEGGVGVGGSGNIKRKNGRVADGGERGFEGVSGEGEGGKAEFRGLGAEIDDQARIGTVTHFIIIDPKLSMSETNAGTDLP